MAKKYRSLRSLILGRQLEDICARTLEGVRLDYDINHFSMWSGLYIATPWSHYHMYVSINGVWTLNMKEAFRVFAQGLIDNMGKGGLTQDLALKMLTNDAFLLALLLKFEEVAKYSQRKIKIEDYTDTKRHADRKLFKGIIPRDAVQPMVKTLRYCIKWGHSGPIRLEPVHQEPRRNEYNYERVGYGPRPDPRAFTPRGGPSMVDWREPRRSVSTVHMGQSSRSSNDPNQVREASEMQRVRSEVVRVRRGYVVGEVVRHARGPCPSPFSVHSQGALREVRREYTNRAYPSTRPVLPPE